MKWKEYIRKWSCPNLGHYSEWVYSSLHLQDWKINRPRNQQELEDGGDMFFRKVNWQRTERNYVPERELFINTVARMWYPTCYSGFVLKEQRKPREIFVRTDDVSAKYSNQPLLDYHYPPRIVPRDRHTTPKIESTKANVATNSQVHCNKNAPSICFTARSKDS